MPKGLYTWLHEVVIHTVAVSRLKKVYVYTDAMPPVKWSFTRQSFLMQQPTLVNHVYMFSGVKANSIIYRSVICKTLLFGKVYSTYSVFEVIIISFRKINFDCVQLDVAICEPVRDVEIVHGLFKMLPSS